MTAEVIVLRLIHIVGGMFWVGATLFMMLFLGPVLGSIGPAAGPFVAGLNRRRFPTIMAIVAILTILSGIRLMMIASAGFQGAYFQAPIGRTFSMAGGMAIVAFIIGMAVTRPAMTRAGELGQQLASAGDDAARGKLVAEMERMRKRGMVGGMIVVTLLLLAAAGMAVARYMG